MTVHSITGVNQKWLPLRAAESARMMSDQTIIFLVVFKVLISASDSGKLLACLFISLVIHIEYIPVQTKNAKAEIPCNSLNSCSSKNATHGSEIHDTIPNNNKVSLVALDDNPYNLL